MIIKILMKLLLCIGLPVQVHLYDARVRTALKRVAHWLNIPWHNFVSFEILITRGQTDEKYETKDIKELQS